MVHIRLKGILVTELFMSVVVFQDMAYEERVNSVTGEVEYTGRIQRRLVLVLDCVVANEFTDKMSDLMNLQHYVIREKRLSEKEAVVIFFDIVRIIDCLHRVGVWNFCPVFYKCPCCEYAENVCHRD